MKRSQTVKKIEIVIDGLPPSSNHAYHWGNYGKRFMTKSAKEFKANVRQLAQQIYEESNFVIPPAQTFFYLDVEFEFKNNRFPDPNNMLKILIDALEGVLFINDKYCMPRVMRCSITGRDRTKVTIKY